jgi:hypothetical protein
MSILMRIQSEVNMRTCYESQQKTTYLLGEVRQRARDRPRRPAVAIAQQARARPDLRQSFI